MKCPYINSYETNSIKRCKPMMGTYVEVFVEAHLSDDCIIEITNEVFQEIRRIEDLMSFHDSESELSKINKDAFNHRCKISDEMEEVLSLALKLSKLTNGSYDISVAPLLINKGLLPGDGEDYDEEASWQDITLLDGTINFNKNMIIDLGGIAKGYAVDKAFELVADKVDNIVINAGGDIRVKHWQGQYAKVKAVNENGEKILVSVPMQDQALATSASYYIDGDVGAIFSPFTKKAINDDYTVSVFASNCCLADALTKVTFLEKENIVDMSLLGFKAMLIDNKGTITSLC